MVEILLHFLCGFSAGLLGGYLGLGGGEVIVPFLTIVLGHNLRTAVPVSVVAVIVNAMSSSMEYLKSGMVDLELVLIVSIFMVIGNITGSSVSVLIADHVVRLILMALLVYTALTLLKRRRMDEQLVFADNRQKYMGMVVALAFVIGGVAGLVGVGGGVLLMPLLYLVVGCPLSTARGTTALIIVFSSAAAATVYLLYDAIDFAIVAPVVFGILIGGRMGGLLGTIAKPIVIRVLFFVVMMYLAWRFAADALPELL